MLPRLICLLLVLAPVVLPAQQPNPPNDPAALAPKGGGRGRGGVTGPVDLAPILANAGHLETGRQLYEIHCATCHGPKGEGSRGPTLALPHLPRATDDAALVRIIQNGIPGTEMTRARLNPGEGPYLAAYVRTLALLPQEPVPGDPANGAELFRSKGACLTCHRLKGEGMAIGPDLTTIGLRRGPASLRQSLVDPGAEVPQSTNAYRNDISLPLNFRMVHVRTKDGREITGIRLNEDTLSVQLRDLTGMFHSFFKDELAEFRKDRSSPMPVYAQVFSPPEMDDMIAFLVSLR
jgi:putative heme-binding domain-containing protein